mmetsp:Transcript_26223/g.73515  ORF Transcript_26223/g.73515 Transcript_26223/m.73515 type:complete len:233 (+) Transcript_26223:1285-1983(+)
MPGRRITSGVGITPGIVSVSVPAARSMAGRTRLMLGSFFWVSTVPSSDSTAQRRSCSRPAGPTGHASTATGPSDFTGYTRMEARRGWPASTVGGSAAAEGAGRPSAWRKYLAMKSWKAVRSAKEDIQPKEERTAPVGWPSMRSLSSQQTWPAEWLRSTVLASRPRWRAHAPGLQKQPVRSRMPSRAAMRSTSRQPTHFPDGLLRLKATTGPCPPGPCPGASALPPAPAPCQP